MALAHSPSVVTDGLVLCLDAANPKSYPGSGTTWNDLSGNGNNGTLVNGVGYSGDNLGSLSFDGVDDRGTFASPISASSPQTYEVWAKGTAVGTQYAYFLHNNSVSTNIGSACFAICITTSNGAGALQPGEIFAFFDGTNTNRWQGMGTGVISNNNIIRQIVLTWDGSTQIVYVDGTQRNSIAYSSTPPNFSNTTSFGDHRNTVTRPLSGNIYSIKAYNRALTPQEIQQNFNALRGRYGI